MANFGSLWIGDSLTLVAKTTLSSFIYHGHSITLFTYDMDLDVPSGVIKEDAAKIFSRDEVFIVDNSVSGFSDMFRYKMIQETDLIWTDMDSLCLTSSWNYSDYVFCYEPNSNGSVNVGTLHFPQNSAILLELIESSINFDKTKMIWAEIGPQLVTSMITKHGLVDLILPEKTFAPIGYEEWQKFWSPGYKKEVLTKCAESSTLHIWNQMKSRTGESLNEFPKGSALEHFSKIFNN